eukprot:gb/GECG01010510.1/.p1 GENE.gb/GECG01010510.1/~~gb/GECG01010510.1/.p1  ORF type:complete len:111 (+),score=9.86 gb/GECG01010510.1/:1-333(+)
MADQLPHSCAAPAAGSGSDSVAATITTHTNTQQSHHEKGEDCRWESVLSGIGIYSPRGSVLFRAQCCPWKNQEHSSSPTQPIPVNLEKLGHVIISLAEFSKRYVAVQFKL